MNVNRVNYLTETYQNSFKKAAGTVKKPGYGLDEISISSEGRLMDMAKKAAASLPDIREERVSMLAKKIESGSYNISAASVAKLLLD